LAFFVSNPYSSGPHTSPITPFLSKDQLDTCRSPKIKPSGFKAQLCDLGQVTTPCPNHRLLSSSV
jgi:hypothetical protein